MITLDEIIEIVSDELKSGQYNIVIPDNFQIQKINNAYRYSHSNLKYKNDIDLMFEIFFNKIGKLIYIGITIQLHSPNYFAAKDKRFTFVIEEDEEDYYDEIKKMFGQLTTNLEILHERYLKEVYRKFTEINNLF